MHSTVPTINVQGTSDKAPEGVTHPTNGSDSPAMRHVPLVDSNLPAPCFWF